MRDIRTAAILAMLALPAAAQDFPAANGSTLCTLYPDTWEIRAPTAAEELEHGRAA